MSENVQENKFNSRSKLKKIFFKDFVTLQRGFDLPKKDMVSGPYPVFGSTSIIGYHSEYKVLPPGVVTGRSGSLGEVQYIREKYWPHNTSLWVRDFKGNFPRYVYYFLKTLDLKNFNSGVGVPTLNRNDLDTLELAIHDYPTQRKIASILSAYDDLIENNTRRIRILEEMAQAIYTEWFVNFRFPGHEKVKMVESELGLIPKGWEVKNLFDIAEVTYGFPFKSKQFTEKADGKPVIRIRDILNNQTKTFTSEKADNKYILHNGDILIGMDGDFHMGKWAGGEAYLNQRIVRLRPKNGLSSYYLFLALKSPIQHFNSTIVGTTVTHLSDKDLHSINLLVPDKNPSKIIKGIFGSLFNLEIRLHLKNVILRRTRDLLLPKLIRGEIEVEELDINNGRFPE